MIKTIKGILKPDVITNIFYLFTGFACIYAFYPFLMVLSALTLGLLSGVHHYYHKDSTAYGDWLGIYMVFNCLLAYSAVPSGSAPLAWFILTVGAMAIDIFNRGRGRPVILGVIGGALLLSIIVNYGFESFLEIAAYFSMAFIPWKIAEDMRVTNFNKYSLYHGFWHVLTAYAIWKSAEIIFASFVLNYYT